MSEVQALAEQLDNVAARLNRGRAVNYCADFALRDAPGAGDRTFDEILPTAIGAPVAIASSAAVSPAEACSEVQRALEYRGDSGSHPNLEFLDSVDGRREIQSVVHAATELFMNADRIASIELSEGHPFYPVFWNFVFVIVRLPDAIVFVGSASD